MPIYEYVCNKCSEEFEELVFSSSEKINCPQCGSKHVKRALSVFSYSSGGSYSSSAGSSCDSCTSGNCTNCGCH